MPRVLPSNSMSMDVILCRIDDYIPAQVDTLTSLNYVHVHENSFDAPFKRGNGFKLPANLIVQVFGLHVLLLRFNHPVRASTQPRCKRASLSRDSYKRN